MHYASAAVYSAGPGFPRVVHRCALRQLCGGRLRLIWLCESGAVVAQRYSASGAAVGPGFFMAKPRLGFLSAWLSTVFARRHNRADVPGGAATVDGGIYRCVRRERTLLCRTGVGR